MTDHLSCILPTITEIRFPDDSTRPFSLSHLSQKYLLLNILTQKGNCGKYLLKGYCLVVITFENLCLFFLLRRKLLSLRVSQGKNLVGHHILETPCPMYQSSVINNDLLSPEWASNQQPSLTLPSFFSCYSYCLLGFYSQPCPKGNTHTHRHTHRYIVSSKNF